MLTLYHKAAHDKEIKSIAEFKPGSWIHVENPTVKEIDYLTHHFHIDQKLLNDAIDMYAVPRIEKGNNLVYIFTRFAYTENDHILTAPLLIGYDETFLLTLSPISFPRINDLLHGKVNVNSTNKNTLLINLLSEIEDTFNDYLTAISKKVRGIRIQIEKVQNKDIVQYVSSENVLNDFSLALERNANNINTLLAGKFIRFTQQEIDLLEELALSNNQLIHLASSTLRALINIREAYSTIMTNNLNRIIKLFTSLTVILTIPTIISSFYGMNVSLPFADSPFSFINIALLTAIVCLLILIIFIAKDWL